MICWLSPPLEDTLNHNRLVIQRYSATGTALGDFEPLTVDHGSLSEQSETYQSPSFAISRDGSVGAAWLGFCGPVCRPDASGVPVLTSSFTFFSSPEPKEVPDGDNPTDLAPSAGVSNNLNLAVGFVTQAGFPQGLLFETSVGGPGTIETCVDNPNPGDHWCFPDLYQPSVAQRSDGKWAIVWSAPEAPNLSFTPFNVAIRICAANGALLAQRDSDGTGWVNDPSIEQSPSDQNSPAVDFDDAGNIVVAWVGNNLAGCTRHPVNIFARRLIYAPATGIRDPNPAAGEGFAGQFVVDNDPDADAGPLGPQDAHPAVALTRDTSRTGAFVIAFNTFHPDGTLADSREVHAQFFDAIGRAVGHEFRVNQSDSPTDNDNQRVRLLARSAAHTIAYGPSSQVVCTWAASHVGGDVSQPWFTLLPAGYANLQCDHGCTKGDINEDTLRDGRDIQQFAVALINGLGWSSCREVPVDFCKYDCDSDCEFNAADWQPFVCILLGRGPTCGAAYSPPPPPIPDCNANSVDDAVDIALGTSADCNANGAPDECELGWRDCNSNGVPDDCDVNPADPDGDGIVYSDCNNSSLPDECDFELPLNPSYDCNENGIPDECDIASHYSADANENGIPDECDLELGRSEGESAVDEEAAWLEFYEWQTDEQAGLSAMPHVERFEATRDKLRELGLPEAIPWARVYAP